MEVRCPRCDALNPAEAIFCSSCGGQLRSALDRDSGPLNLSRSDAPNVPGRGVDAPTPPPFVAPPPPPPQHTAASDVHTSTSPDMSAATGLDGPPPQHSAAPWDLNTSAASDVSVPTAPVPTAPSPHAAYAPQQGYGAPGSAPQQPYDPGAYAQYPPGAAAYGVAPYGVEAHGGMNSSGMGPGYPLPYQTQGWTFAGFVPFGLFAFVNGSVLWGVLYWLLGFLSLSLVYNIYVGIKGRELAWQSRRFDSVQQFEETMAAWNRWGIISLIASIVLIGLVFAGYMMLVFSLVAGDLASGL